jgi:endonuclease/exonuclease/phosphatase (EEP) superfamily protein YafD
LTASAIWSWASLFLPSPQPAAGSTKIRILSANVLMANQRLDDFLQLVADVDPDVVVILEYTKRWDRRLSTFHEQFPYSATRPQNDGFGIGLFSKRPLHDVETLNVLEFFEAPAICCAIDVEGQRCAVTALHAVSPLSAARFDLRNEQLRKLAARIGVTGPRIVVGDFNATTWSPFMADFLKATRLRDSRQGYGLQISWPQFCWPLSIPIDHALVSDEIHVHRRWVEYDIGSDHFPIVIEASLAPAVSAE